MDFTARAEAESVVLNWSTAAELNAKDFVVQHSNAGLDWYDIATVAATGNSNTVQQYHFTHNEPVSGTNYYRLKQRDLDNHVSYSAIKKVSFTSAARRIVILGNPVMNNILRVSLSESAILSVKSLDGRTIVTKNLTAGRHQIDLGNQPPGTYLLVSGTEVIKFLVR
ncbi:MAG: hypothetical protein NVV59_07235 [Chitinophagaceae bacterium]|nr:hypothetical protein [Chitinophagaceae bacterium]